MTVHPDAGIEKNSARIGAVVEEYCLETTIHGFKDFIKSGPLRRALWSLLLVTMVVLMVYQAQNQFFYYISRPISTNIALKYPEELPFPTVLICNMNRYRISYVRDHKLFNLLQATSTKTPMEESTWRNLTNDIDIPNSNDSRQFLIEAGHQLDDMLISCNLPNGKRCSAKDFSILVTDFGVCYTWNKYMNKALTVRSGGAETDLYMMFNIEAYERTPGITRSVGLKMLIHDQDTAPSISETAIDVAPGYQFSIALQRIEKYRIGPKDGGNCDDSMNLTHFPDGPYSYDMCKIDKTIQTVLHDCGCLPYNTPDYDDVLALIAANKSIEGYPPLCTVKQHFLCVVYRRGRALDTARTGCPQSCKSVSLKPTLSFAKNPIGIGIKAMGPGRADSFIKRYNKAIEAVERLDPDAVKQTQDAIDELYSVKKWLKENHLEPIFATFQTSHDRLLKLECYSNTSYNTKFLYNSLVSAKVGAGSVMSFLRILHPELPLKSLIVDHSGYASKYKYELEEAKTEILSILKEFTLLTGFFHSDTFAPEMTLNIEEYQRVFDMLALYENQNITKIELADRITMLENLKAGITASIIDPMNKNVVTNLLWYAVKSNYSTQVRELKKTLSNDVQSQLLMQVLLPLADRPRDCVKEVLSTTNSLKDEVYNIDFSINSICPPQIDVESFPKIIGEMESCFFGDVREAVVELSGIVLQIKPLLARAFSGITLYLQNFANEMGATSTNLEYNFLALNIFYSDLSVEQQIQSRSYSFWSFLCDIGGTLGLFLGASIVTIYELIDFFILKPLFHYLKFSNQIKPEHYS